MHEDDTMPCLLLSSPPISHVKAAKILSSNPMCHYAMFECLHSSKVRINTGNRKEPGRNGSNIYGRR